MGGNRGNSPTDDGTKSGHYMLYSTSLQVHEGFKVGAKQCCTPATLWAEPWSINTYMYIRIYVYVYTYAYIYIYIYIWIYIYISDVLAAKKTSQVEFE